MKVNRQCILEQLGAFQQLQDEIQSSSQELRTSKKPTKELIFEDNIMTYQSNQQNQQIITVKQHNNIIKEVMVQEKIVYKEIVVEKPVQVFVEKQVQVEVIVEKQVPVQKIVVKEIIKEVPIQKIIEKQIIVQKIVYKDAQELRQINGTTQGSNSLELQPLNTQSQESTQESRPFDYYSMNSPRFIQGKSEEINEDVQLLREENNILKTEITELRSINDSLLQLQNQIGSLKNKISELNSAKTFLQDQNMDYERMRQQSILEKVDLQKQLQDASHKNQELFNILSQKEKEVEIIKKQLENTVNQYESALIYKNNTQKANFQPELNEEREENDKLRIMLEDMSNILQNQKSETVELEKYCESLQNQKQSLISKIDQADYEQKMQGAHSENNLRDKFNEMEQRIFQLQEEREYLLFNLQKTQRQLSQLGEDYNNERQINAEKDLHINELKKDINQQRLKLVTLRKQNSEEDKIKLHQSKSQQILSNYDTRSACSASLDNKARLLSGTDNRRAILNQIKKPLKHIENIEAANKILNLAQQLYLQSQSKERSSIQMKEMIISLQSKIEQSQKAKTIYSSNKSVSQKEEEYISNLQNSVARYEKILFKADSQKSSLISQISTLERENHQIRLELSNSQIDKETQHLIEQLTLQLQNEKYSAKKMNQQNDELRYEMIDLEKELNNKNRQIKLMNLSFMKRKDQSFQDNSVRLSRN